MMNRDVTPSRWAVRDILRDVIGHVQLVLFLKNQNAHGGELLGHRGEPKYRIGGVRGAKFSVGQPIRLGEDDVSVRGNQRSSAKLLFSRQPGKIFIGSRTETGRISRAGNCCPQKRN